MSIPTVPADYNPRSPAGSQSSLAPAEPQTSDFKEPRIAASEFDDFTANPNEASQVAAAREPLPSPLAGPPLPQSSTTTSNSSPVLVEKEVLPEDPASVTTDRPADQHDHLQLDALGGTGPSQSSAATQDVTSGAHEATPAIAPNEPHVHNESIVEPEAQNIGWNEPADEIAAPLVTGLANDDLWQLLRRFDMQMSAVRALPTPPKSGLDLESSPDEEFALDKLRSNFERLYMTVFIGMLAFVKHIARLRSWHEKRRTTYFCAAYFAAWALNLLVPLLLGLLIALVVYPPARTAVFPPAPMAAVDAKTGALQTPKAGTLASESLTGAPEAHKGQAVEQEASNFVSGIASVAVGAAMGKKPVDPARADSAEEKQGSVGTKVPDPVEAVAASKDVREAAEGAAPGSKHDKTKQPMQEQIWLKARPVMRGVAQTADTWEMFANALSPTPPFSRDAARLKLGGALAPVFLISLVLPAAWVIRGTTFLLGLAFFSQPWISRGWHWLNTNYPNWMDQLDLKKTLLYGVPTNAQLTITLLRLAEAHKAPLPPAPLTSYVPPPDAPAARQIIGDTPVTADHDEIMANSVPAEQVSQPAGASPPGKEKKKHGKKLIGFVKGVTRAGVSTILGVDQVKAAAGSESALQKRGVLPKRGAPKPADGPSGFTARLHGKKGTAYIITTATTPSVSFEHASYTASKANPVFSIALDEIQEIRKIGGLGWKTKLVVGFALGMEVSDGMTIQTKTGESYTLTAMPRRDEMFNRLISMTDSFWEAM